MVIGEVMSGEGGGTYLTRGGRTNDGRTDQPGRDGEDDELG